MEELPIIMYSFALASLRETFLKKRQENAVVRREIAFPGIVGLIRPTEH